MAIWFRIALLLAAGGMLRGETVLHQPLRNPASVSGVYVLADDFSGEAAIVLDGVEGVTLRDFVVKGNRGKLAQRQELPPYDRTFASWFGAGGVLVRGGARVVIERARFEEIAGFAVLASRVRGVAVRDVTVMDSGSIKANGRNNTTGGVLIEDGSVDWEVSRSVFERVSGNAVWTHSRYTAPRNERGQVVANRFREIGRDAVQVGHAVAVTVEGNEGERIGYPKEVVDVEGGGTPVGVDTAGNVEGSRYVRNTFRDVNGKCIDLDGFHHGLIEGNRCYDLTHFGIVMNNTNPDMQSVGIRIVGNWIEGAPWGGIFVLGGGHVIERNVLRRMQRARCSDVATPGCVFLAAEPDMLRTGIYLGERAERPAMTRGNRIVDNEISGWRMDRACVGYGPNVKRTENTVRGNRCRHEPGTL
jgi:hypothetical protein